MDRLCVSLLYSTSASSSSPASTLTNSAQGSSDATSNPSSSTPSLTPGIMSSAGPPFGNQSSPNSETNSPGSSTSNFSTTTAAANTLTECRNGTCYGNDISCVGNISNTCSLHSSQQCYQIVQTNGTELIHYEVGCKSNCEYLKESANNVTRITRCCNTNMCTDVQLTDKKNDASSMRTGITGVLSGALVFFLLPLIQNI